MRKHITTVVMFAGMFAAGVAQAQPPSKNYVLQFSENFQGDHVDTTRWNYRTDVKMRSTQLPTNVSVSNGQLIVTPKKESFAGMEFTGGGVISKVPFRYGYFQVDAQTIGDPGWHASFWLMAGDGRTTFPMIARTEIDDFEIEGVAPEKVSMGYLVWKDTKNLGSKRCNNSYMPGYSTAAGMHTYGVEWTEQDITYYLDGKNICSQPYPITAGMHDPLNIWLTAIASKDVKVSGNSTAKFANLRYYIRDYYIGANEPGYIEYGKDWKSEDKPGFSGLPTRTSCTAGVSAMWAPQILEAGKYNVQLWNVGADESAITIHASGADTKKQVAANTSDGWQDLGTYAFEKGTGGHVIVAPASGKCLTTSMVKFVRQ